MLTIFQKESNLSGQMKNQEYLNPLDVVDKSAYLSILLTGILIAILSLIVPVAAQMLVNIVAFSRIIQPIVLISVVVLAMLIGSTILSVWQYIIVEIIQQKLFAKTVINSAINLPILNPKIFFQYKGPEIVNHFFDVVTIQKTLASILIYGTNIIISTIFGMVLMAFYHPYFLLLDIGLIFSVGLAILFPYKFALAMAHEECKQKHKIGSWLEEIIENNFLFKFNDNKDYAIRETDKRLINYLQARNKHFSMIVRHIGSIHIISAIAICLLLGIGGYLVTINQLSLGQLVAAEIVLSGITTSLKHFSVLMKDYYDMRASNLKVEQLLNLECEQTQGSLSEEIAELLDISVVKFRNFCENNYDEQKLNHDLSLQNPLFFNIEEENLASLVMDFLSGFNVYYKGTVLVNEIHTDSSKWIELRKYVARLNNLEIFNGTIIENIALGKNKDVAYIMKVLADLGLLEKISDLSDGLDTVISKNKVLFTLTELKIIMVARVILSKPKILLLDGFLDDLPEQQCLLVRKALFKYSDAILILFSRQKQYIKMFDQHKKNT